MANPFRATPHASWRCAALLLALLAGCGSPQKEPNAPIGLGDLPAAVLSAAQRKFPDVKITSAWQTPTGNFELSGQNKRGKLHELVVTPTGEVLQAE